MLVFKVLEIPIEVEILSQSSHGTFELKKDT